MAELLDDIIALEDAACRCIPRLKTDPVVQKCGFDPSRLNIVDVEYDNKTRQMFVVLEPCGPLGDYVAVVLREFLAEEGIDAWVRFIGQNKQSH